MRNKSEEIALSRKKSLFAECDALIAGPQSKMLMSNAYVPVYILSSRAKFEDLYDDDQVYDEGGEEMDDDPGKRKLYLPFD